MGIRHRHTVPAWNAGDRVEERGTGLRGVLTRPTTLDYSRWEMVLANGRWVEVPAQNLVLAVPPGGPVEA